MLEGDVLLMETSIVAYYASSVRLWCIGSQWLVSLVVNFNAKLVMAGNLWRSEYIAEVS
jgi:hypothetical protein